MESAASQIGEDGREYFILNGEVGVQEVYAFFSRDLQKVLILHCCTTIFFPILVDRDVILWLLLII